MGQFLKKIIPGEDFLFKGDEPGMLVFICNRQQSHVRKKHFKMIERLMSKCAEFLDR